MRRKNLAEKYARRQTVVAAAIALAFAGQAAAFEIETGIDDLTVRFDNTIRYNLGKRLDSQKSEIINNPNLNDGDRNFGKYAIVANRIDLLTEFDVVWRGNFGGRVSAVSWYDHAYSGGFDNTSAATSNHLENGRPAVGLSDYAERYYEGLSGEFMDAYVFGGFDIGDMNLRLRAGRHTVNWGESLLGSGAIHGIAYGQAPLDQGKALATPGIEAKELYLPRTQLSAQLQVTPTVSVGAQYFFEWRNTRIPESGTYLGFADYLQRGGESLILNANPRINALHGDDITPKDSGDWGVMGRWSPEWLDGTLGFYVRQFSDTLPQTIVLRANPITNSRYFLNYGANVDMYGVSLAKQIGGVSVGVDVNYRHDMPLFSDQVIIDSAAKLPARGDILGARGNTVHGVLNLLGTLPQTVLWDTVSWATEFTWAHWVNVTSDPSNVFKGRDGYIGIDRVTRNSFTGAINVTPTWYQVFPGADLYMPLSYSVGLSGNTPVSSGGNEGAGAYAIGLGLDLYSRYRFDLKYVDYFGKASYANGVLVTPSGTQALLKDRGAIYLTFKTTI